MDIKTIKIVLKPDEDQKNSIERAIKYSRYVYNFLLKARFENWKNNHKNFSFDEEKEILKKLKRKNGWLKNVDNATLEQAIMDLDSDYYRFFKLNGQYPKYRKKDDKIQCYRTKNVNNNIKLYCKQNMITLPKLDIIKMETQEKIHGKVTHVKVNKSDGKYEAIVTVRR